MCNYGYLCEPESNWKNLLVVNKKKLKETLEFCRNNYRKIFNIDRQFGSITTFIVNVRDVGKGGNFYAGENA